MIHPSKRVKKRKPKPVHYVEVTFKLSKQQRRSIKAFCRDHDTTLNKLIKNNIRRYMNYKPLEKPPVHPRQLDLWNETAEENTIVHP
ncbi:MAG: hypothetical protein PHR53_08195 [Bacteroidales bacterium]|nr:hypothetical protein [Bacteroidales bacterium]